MYSFRAFVTVSYHTDAEPSLWCRRPEPVLSEGYEDCSAVRISMSGRSSGEGVNTTA